ncbi:MAG: hypothetical protein HY794_17195 [Desulfarculus sp.]|nr:hypothetical protein [Desulfarculus sp.]
MSSDWVDGLLAAAISGAVSLSISLYQSRQQRNFVQRQLEENERTRIEDKKDVAKQSARNRLEKIEMIARRIIEIEKREPANDLDVLHDLKRLAYDVTALSKLIRDENWKKRIDRKLISFRKAVSNDNHRVDSAGSRKTRIQIIFDAAVSLEEQLQ